MLLCKYEVLYIFLEGCSINGRVLVWELEIFYLRCCIDVYRNLVALMMYILWIYVRSFVLGHRRALETLVMCLFKLECLMRIFLGCMLEDFDNILWSCRRILSSVHSTSQMVPLDRSKGTLPLNDYFFESFSFSQPLYFS